MEPAATPTPGCDPCTTPRRCGASALKRDKGPRCAGKADGPDNCDCLNQCGDDPWLNDGRATPCAQLAVKLRGRAMDQHSYEAAWTFVVPPANTRRLVISQRQDGPFRADSPRGSGHYYVSLQALDSRTAKWAHVEGSSAGAFASFSDAHEYASAKWEREAKK